MSEPGQRQDEDFSSPVRTPPLGPIRPAMDLTCGRLIGDGHCGKPGTHHVIWNEETDNGICCAKHWDEARTRWAYYDVHPVCSICTMPDALVVWSWEQEPGMCIWPVDDETVGEVLASQLADAAAELTTAEKTIPSRTSGGPS